ncbi:hypothetical protein HDV01_001358 [Terramyces sp. JEL0728]|nr:hypothetical protein HDV01_001358 [Terramyces sp. JEL0728]
MCGYPCQNNSGCGTVYPDLSDVTGCTFGNYACSTTQIAVCQYTDVFMSTGYAIQDCGPEQHYLSELRSLKAIEKEKEKLEAELDYLNRLTNIDFNLMMMVEDNMRKFSQLKDFVDLHSKMVSEMELEEFKQNLKELEINEDWNVAMIDSLNSAENNSEQQEFYSNEAEIKLKLQEQNNEFIFK